MKRSTREDTKKGWRATVALQRIQHDGYITMMVSTRVDRRRVQECKEGGGTLWLVMKVHCHHDDDAIP